MNSIRTAFPFHTEKLLAEARKISGIDYSDEEVREPLDRLVRSLNEESHLHADGVVFMEDKLLRLLCNRLRIHRDFLRHPEIDEQEIAPPVLLCGLPRTGTTKLQHILSETGDFNYLPLWQATNPALITGSRDESPQWRIDDADRYWQRFNELSPEVKAGHVFDARIADEDNHIRELTFTSSSPFAYSEVPSFIEWQMQQDPRPQYEYLKRVLKYLQWQGMQKSGRPWMLKDPMNVAMHPLLQEVFPGALLVMTHRDPVDVMASACKLMDSFHKPFTDDNGNYAAAVGGFSFAINQQMSDRHNFDLNLMDVHYLDAVKDAGSVIEKIYERIGVPFTGKTRNSISDWEASHPQHQHGVHRYTLEEFGFNKEDVARLFSDYQENLLRLLK